MSESLAATETLIGSSSDSGRMSRALLSLLELSKSLSSEVDINSLLKVVVQNASEVVDAERTSIFVYDPARDMLWTRVAEGLDTTTIELPLGSGIAGDVARTLTLANVTDVYADARFNDAFDRRTGYRTRSMLCCPVLASNGKLLGVVQCVNKKNTERFLPDDELLIRAVASHVGVALERAQLTEMFLESERLESALKLANQIQMRMLPSGDVQTPDDATFELHARIRPARQVGGDFYDFAWDESRLYFCIADVAGKGVGSALVMAVARTLIRANAAIKEDPAELFAAVSARLFEETDTSMFVTGFCGFLDLATGRLRYSNAGHDRPFLLSPGESPRPLDSHPGLPLGVFPSFVYRFQELQLAPGDGIFLYTDGITDATNGAGEFFGSERVREQLERNAGESPNGLIESVVTTLERFVGSAPQYDDLTMLCVRYRGVQTAAS